MLFTPPREPRPFIPDVAAAPGAFNVRAPVVQIVPTSASNTQASPQKIVLSRATTFLVPFFSSLPPTWMNVVNQGRFKKETIT